MKLRSAWRSLSNWLRNVSDSFRTIRWEDDCYADLLAIVGNPRGIDVMVEGIDTVLASEPREGDYVGGPANVWAISAPSRTAIGAW